MRMGLPKKPFNKAIVVDRQLGQTRGEERRCFEAALLCIVRVCLSNSIKHDLESEHSCENHKSTFCYNLI
jgi:hypothetical protein